MLHVSTLSSDYVPPNWSADEFARYKEYMGNKWFPRPSLGTTGHPRPMPTTGGTTRRLLMPPGLCADSQPGPGHNGAPNDQGARPQLPDQHYRSGLRIQGRHQGVRTRTTGAG